MSPLSKPKPDKSRSRSRSPLVISYTNITGLISNFKDIQGYMFNNQPGVFALDLAQVDTSGFRFPCTRIFANSSQGFHPHAWSWHQ